ncbi:hypothetical protein [Nocardia aurantiaca]|uniref:HTH cro/C1-type domain-containing protein n=1 Tax=Nocardia aurantiaca TaxID=2675850 RepID=A0A6I3L6C8_9NOCA|nr:hypothetical protein [Nocardia aurantiaca]MTE16065.1 hypothetical protein [Nocardia aurantiaca]
MTARRGNDPSRPATPDPAPRKRLHTLFGTAPAKSQWIHTADLDQPPLSQDFSARLNMLFQAWESEHGHRLTYNKVVEDLASAGHTVSRSYLSLLRSGQRSNPSDGVVVALAAFFDAEVEYVRTGVSAGGSPTDRFIAEKFGNAPLRRLIRNAAGLSKGSIESLEYLADRLRVMEGLPSDRHTADIS